MTGDFRLRLLSLPVPQSAPHHLAARRCCPRSSKRRGPQQHVSFRGSITRPQRSLSTLRSPPHDDPRKTRLRLVANLCRAGLGYPPGYVQGFSFYMASSLAKLAWRNSNSNSLFESRGHLPEEWASEIPHRSSWRAGFLAQTPKAETAAAWRVTIKPNERSRRTRRTVPGASRYPRC